MQKGRQKVVALAFSLSTIEEKSREEMKTTTLILVIKCLIIKFLTIFEQNGWQKAFLVWFL